MTDQSVQEFRIKRGARILSYVSRFSSTEKTIFGIFVIGAILSAIGLLLMVNNMFLVEVPSKGGILREAEIGLPRTVNPVLAVTDVDRDLTALVYAGLMKYDGAGKLVPSLASSFSVSDDGLVYTFSLRNDARFQDGTKLTAEDVAYTIQKIQDPSLKSPRRADWTDVGVKIIDPATIQFSLKQPYAPFPTNTTVGILPKHIWGSLTDDQFVLSNYNLQPVGAGPFEVSAIARDTGGIPTSYELSQWSGYAGKKPYLDGLRLSFYPDADKALSALDAGLVDSVSTVSAANAARLAADSAQAYHIISTPLPRIFGIFWNQNQNPAIADKNVRTALSLAVDRDAIVKTVFSGYAVPVDGPLPAPLRTIQATSTGADPKAAIALLEKAGWKKNASGIYEKKDKKGSIALSFDIYTSDAPDLKQAAELARDAWAAIGADVGIKIFESSDLYQNVIRVRKYDGLLFGELIGKDRDLFAFWHSSERTAPGLNIALYTNSKVDKALTDLRATDDEQARTARFAEIDSLIRADSPAIFLYSPDFIYAIPRSLRGIDIRSVTVPSDRFSSIDGWYMETENVWRIFVKK